MSYAVISVDVQGDFLPGGPLGVSEGEQILIPLVKYMQGAQLNVASRDWHPDNHFSFADEPTFSDGSWPVHCVQGTKGARINRAVAKLADFTISKGMDRNPPDAYSAFAGKTLRPVETLEEILRRSPIDNVVVGGLALDYCVLHTALDSAALGFPTIVPLDATRGVAPETSAQALIALERAGVQVVSTLG